MKSNIEAELIIIADWFNEASEITIVFTPFWVKPPQFWILEWFII